MPLQVAPREVAAGDFSAVVDGDFVDAPDVFWDLPGAEELMGVTEHVFGTGGAADAGDGFLIAQGRGDAEDDDLADAGALGETGFDFGGVQFAAGDVDDIGGAAGEVHAAGLDAHEVAWG